MLWNLEKRECGNCKFFCEYYIKRKGMEYKVGMGKCFCADFPQIMQRRAIRYGCKYWQKAEEQKTK